MSKLLLLNSANVWETLGVLQMKYSGKLLLFFLQWKHLSAFVIEIRIELKIPVSNRFH